jgi:uncharacterized protein
MILDLKKLKRSGKDTSEFFFEYLPQDQIIDIPNVDLSGAVKVSGSVTLTGDHSAYIEGEVVFTLKGDCTRCLAETEKEYFVEFAEAVSSDDTEGYPVKNDTVDLSKIVDDPVAMNLPVSFLCKEDCRGLCPSCGTNLNDGECKCKN